MQLNRSFLNGNDIHPLFWEQDANTDITGDWISMRDYEMAYVLMHKAGTEDVDDLGLQILQATSAAGGSAKAMAVTRCWYKTGAMTGQGTWTKVDFSTAADFLGFGTALGAADAGGATYATTAEARVVADVNTDAVSILVEIRKSDFDQANGFKFFTAHIEGDNVNNTCLVSAQAIMHQCNFAGAIPPNPLA